jgi:hypothetical protein
LSRPERDRRRSRHRRTPGAGGERCRLAWGGRLGPSGRALALGAWALAAALFPAAADDAPPATGGSESRALAPVAAVDDLTERLAIEKGLRYLDGRALANGAVGERFPVAVTSLAGLAFLGAGHSRGDLYDGRLDACLAYILGSVKDRGFISESFDKSESRMHGHCFALLFLTQVYGELPPWRHDAASIRSAIRRGIDCLVKSQSARGGWEYSPVNDENLDEASVTIGALQALRAAHNIGFLVPAHTIEGARLYVRDCKNADGSFRYSISRAETRSSFALTAAAMSTLHALGVYDSPLLSAGFGYLDRSLAEAGGKPRRAIDDPFFYYGALYSTQAYFQRGGEHWGRWRAEMRRYLLARQRPDGSWPDDNYGDEFGTAMAVLILEVPLQYLPIFQR